MNLLRVFLLRGSLFCGFFVCLLLVPLVDGQVRPRVVEAVDEARRVTLVGNVHPLARPEFDRGAVADAQPINRILLLLKRSDEQEAALQDLLQKQQDKSTPNFHQWLTPEQFGAQFGVADADIQVVTDWLTRQGFSIGMVYSGKTVIEFTGTAAQVQQAFGAAIHNYEVDGKTYSANASNPQIPAALAPVITGVVSLHNFPRQFYARRFGALRRDSGKSVVEPLTTFPNPFAPGNFYGLGPGDFAKIYGVPATCGSGTPAPLCNGAGQTIAIVGETNFNLSDVQQFRSIFGLPATFDQNSIILNGEDPGITTKNEESEALLDTQWSGAAAPGATIKYVLSASTPASQGIDLSALYIVEHNLAAVMSESYGACEALLGSAENSFYNNLWQQASAQGITVSVSTGDSGSAGCDNPNTEGLATHAAAVNGLAATQYNVAVGGTDFDEFGRWNTFWSATNDPATGASALGYIPEIPWNQSCAQLGPSGCNINTTPTQLQNIIAGGGGPSSLPQNSKPSWQMGINGMPNDGKRDQPDISLLASPGFNGTGFLYCQSDLSTPCEVSGGFSGFLRFGVIGGTSASAPAFAGIMALVNQSQATAQNPAPRQGNANYILYALAKNNAASCSTSATTRAGCIFNDIVGGSSALPTGGTGMGTNSVPCKAGAGCSFTASNPIGILHDPNNPSTIAWNSGPGYDMATGLGSLNVGNLVTAWGNASTVQTTTTLTLSPTTGITHGSENVTVTISVAAKSGTAKGTVSLTALLPTPSNVGTTSFEVGEFTLGANGSVTGTTQNLPGGAGYQVHAHYSGDGVNAPSDSATQTVTVAQESSKTFLVVPTFDPTTGNQISGNATSVTYGSPYIVRVYVTNGAGLGSTTGAPSGACTQSSNVACPSGTITLTANGDPADGGTFNLNTIGYTRDISPTLPGGTYPLAAAYSGDASYTASNTSETFTVNVAPTTLSAPFIGSSIGLIGQQASFNATVSTQAFTGVAPTGTITFYDGSTALTGPVTLTPTPPTGSAPSALSGQISTTFNTTGNHTITAKYSGDGNYGPTMSTSSTTLDVVYQTAMSLNGSASNINFGQSVTLTATITSLGKNPPMTGQVQFNGPSTTFSNVTATPGTDGNGNQMLTVAATTVPQGSGAYSATYAGDTNYEAASSPGLPVNVNIPDFTLGPQSGLSVVPVAGQTGSGQIMVTPVSQTPSTVTLQVPSVMIAGYTIMLSPLQVNLNGMAVPATLTLAPNATTPATAVRAQARKASIFPSGEGGRWNLSLAVGLLVLLLRGSPRRRRKFRAALGLSFVGLLYFALGCGGGGGGGGPSPQPTSVSLTTSNAKVSAGQPLTITATVTGGATFKGGMTFYDYGVAVTPALPVSAAQPQVQIGSSDLILGVHQLTAKYSGDTNNQPSTSAALSQTITGTFVTSITGATGSDTHAMQVTLGLQ